MSDQINHECGLALIRLLKPLDFYKKNGAIILDDWRVALMDDKAIQKFVKNEGI